MINSEVNGKQTLVYAKRMTDTPIKDTRKQVKRQMSQQRQQVETALWRCESCRIWWGSGSNTRDAGALMQYVAKMMQPQVWDDYRGWHNMTAIATCPQCGRLASPFLQPRSFRPNERLQPQQSFLEVAL